MMQGTRFLIKGDRVMRSSFEVGEDYADFHRCAKVQSLPARLC